MPNLVSKIILSLKALALPLKYQQIIKTRHSETIIELINYEQSIASVLKSTFKNAEVDFTNEALSIIMNVNSATASTANSAYGVTWMTTFLYDLYSYLDQTLKAGEAIVYVDAAFISYDASGQSTI